MNHQYEAGERVRFESRSGAEVDTGTVIDPKPNRDERILVRWSSGAESWAKLECLRPMEWLQ